MSVYLPKRVKTKIATFFESCHLNRLRISRKWVKLFVFCLFAFVLTCIERIEPRTFKYIRSPWILLLDEIFQYILFKFKGKAKRGKKKKRRSPIEKWAQNTISKIILITEMKNSSLTFRKGLEHCIENAFLTYKRWQSWVNWLIKVTDKTNSI